MLPTPPLPAPPRPGDSVLSILCSYWKGGGGKGEWELEVVTGDWRVGSAEWRARNGELVVSERVLW